jgi:hypothetical protein
MAFSNILYKKRVHHSILFNDYDNDSSNNKLLEAIQNAAANPMLNESQVAKQLVAGSIVISSMVAKKR